MQVRETRFVSVCSFTTNFLSSKTEPHGGVVVSVFVFVLAGSVVPTGHRYSICSFILMRVFVATSVSIRQGSYTSCGFQETTRSTSMVITAFTGQVRISLLYLYLLAARSLSFPLNNPLAAETCKLILAPLMSKQLRY